MFPISEHLAPTEVPLMENGRLLSRGCDQQNRVWRSVNDAVHSVVLYPPGGSPLQKPWMNDLERARHLTGSLQPHAEVILRPFSQCTQVDPAPKYTVQYLLFPLVKNHKPANKVPGGSRKHCL